LTGLGARLLRNLVSTNLLTCQLPVSKSLLFFQHIVAHSINFPPAASVSLHHPLRLQSLSTSMSDRSSSPEQFDPREELARMMCPNFEGNDIPSGITSPPSPTGSPSLQSSRTNATLHARRVAARLSLGPYGRELESFATEDPANRTLLLFARLLAVEQKVSKIVVSSGAFTVSKALLVCFLFFAFLPTGPLTDAQR
jgi:hypothetical protein